MGMHMERQVVHLMESFVADIALELFLTAVRQLVVLVIPFRRKRVLFPTVKK